MIPTNPYSNSDSSQKFDNKTTQGGRPQPKLDRSNKPLLMPKMEFERAEDLPKNQLPEKDKIESFVGKPKGNDLKSDSDLSSESSEDSLSSSTDSTSSVGSQERMNQIAAEKKRGKMQDLYEKARDGSEAALSQLKGVSSGELKRGKESDATFFSNKYLYHKSLNGDFYNNPSLDKLDKDSGSVGIPDQNTGKVSMNQGPETSPSAVLFMAFYKMKREFTNRYEQNDSKMIDAMLEFMEHKGLAQQAKTIRSFLDNNPSKPWQEIPDALQAKYPDLF